MTSQTRMKNIILNRIYGSYFSRQTVGKATTGQDKAEHMTNYSTNDKQILRKKLVQQIPQRTCNFTNNTKSTNIGNTKSVNITHKIGAPHYK